VPIPINLFNDATNNSFSYTIFEGSSTGTAGVFRFSDGVTTGNDNNIIDYCKIKEAGTNLPLRGIVSAGNSTAGKENSSITISNNEIYNMFGAEGVSAGIFLQNGCNTNGSDSWTITGNSIYQTANRTATGELMFRGISISHPNNTNFIIEDNNIGGKAPLCGSTAWSQSGSTNTFVGIYLNIATTGTVSSVKGNTIKNIDLTSASTKENAGIYVVAGSVNIGDLTSGNGNTIGNPISYAFSNTSSLGFTGILLKGGASSVFTAINNTISGITGSNEGPVAGISSIVNGKNTISNNTISTLSSATSSTGVGTLSGVTGIEVSSTVAGHTISQNTLGSLVSTHTSAAVNIVGIYYAGGTTGTNMIDRNLIHSFNSTASGTVHNGIMVASGQSTTFRNNMIRLGITSANPPSNSVTTAAQITGILDASAVATNNYKFYNNSVYIGGTSAPTTQKSYAFRRSTSNTTIDIRNNIFQNSRASAAGSPITHYSISLNSTTNVSFCNYNLYYGGAATNGYYFGRVNTTDYADHTAWLATGFDPVATSYFSDPLYMAPTAAVPNLHIDTLWANISAISLADGNAYPTSILVADDFDGQTRNVTPTYYHEIGADEFCVRMRTTPLDPNPVDNACNVTNPTFTITHEGSRGHVFVWEVSTNGGTSWSTISTGGVYTINATTGSLTISNTAGLIGYKYRCIMNNECSHYTSNVVTINGYINGTGNTITWTSGAGTTDWNTADNWDCRIPIVSDNVIVPSPPIYSPVTPIYPVISTATTGNCYTIDRKSVV
jgi:hypothetical protein